MIDSIMTVLSCFGAHIGRSVDSPALPFDFGVVSGGLNCLLRKGDLYCVIIDLRQCD